MYQKIYINFIILFACFLININTVHSEIVNKIEIIGNERISDDTVELFSQVSLEDDLTTDDLNTILKNLYETNFFKNVSVELKNNILSITILENPIIETINYNGIKSNKLIDQLKEDALLKSRSSYNEFILSEEKKRLINLLKEIGYYNPEIDIILNEENDNLVTLNLNFDLGNKAKIKKITFIGDKIFKDKKLRRIIASTEYKYWKFLSGRKFLNEQLVEFDKRLLINFYKNNGFYNVKVNSSFAKLLNKDEFELIFNIDAKSKVFFGDLTLNLPSDFDENNFQSINKLFLKLKGETYSLNLIDKILDEIDTITTLEQYKFINASVNENLENDKINLEFIIQESEKYYIDKINIFGNNVTAENVIRNQFEVDEGDPFNEILVNKSINNLKSLGFFKTVDKEIIDVNNSNTKIINLTVKEKPTGEISAQAGVGTDGSSIGFGVKENNYLGKGIALDTNFSLSSDSFRGKFSITNPNYKNTDKSFYFSAEALETDNYQTFGYKTNKTGFSVGSNFEYLNDLFLGIGNSNYYEKIETNSTASTRQQSQEGDYWDTFINLDLNYDKRDQKFQTSSGFRSFYSVGLPILSDTNTLKNFYSHSYF